MNLWYDSETFSPVPLGHGTGAYVVQCELMLVTYAIDDGPVETWSHVEHEPMPRDLFAALKDPAVTITAHNSFFDRSVLNACGFGKYYDLSIRRWRCVMAQALAHGLPGGLDKLGEVFNLDEDDRKVKEGRRLIHLFCKPLRDGTRATHRTHPKEWDEFAMYARQDVVAMREVAKRLPTWNYPDNLDELNSWFLDQERNDRGICIDLELCHAATRATSKAKRQLARQTQEQTDDMVERATQRDKLLAYILLAYGVDLPDMQAATLERRLDDPELPEAVKELLRIRLEASMNSQSKYSRAIRAASPDGRVRGTIQWCGASRTGRDAGRILQPQNFPRPSIKADVIEQGIQALKLECEELLCA